MPTSNWLCMCCYGSRPYLKGDHHTLCLTSRLCLFQTVFYKNATGGRDDRPIILPLPGLRTGPYVHQVCTVRLESGSSRTVHHRIPPHPTQDVPIGEICEIDIRYPLIEHRNPLSIHHIHDMHRKTKTRLFTALLFAGNAAETGIDPKSVKFEPANSASENRENSYNVRWKVRFSWTNDITLIRPLPNGYQKEEKKQTLSP